MKHVVEPGTFELAVGGLKRDFEAVVANAH
jgi:hypothetical protein